MLIQLVKSKSQPVKVTGAASRLASEVAILILIVFAFMSLEEVENFKPSLVFPNEPDNTLSSI